MGLWYSKYTGMSLIAYLNSDHAGCQDTRRSTSGSAQFLGDKLPSWSSKKQKSTAISSTKAEYIALSGCYVPEIFMQQFWYTIKKVQDTDSYEFLLANKKCIVNAESEDYQEYGLPIPDVMLTDAIKRKKTVEESHETVDVSEESEPEPEPAKKKTSIKRRAKKKVTLSADDNIISDDPDAALKLAKSISQTEAEEAEAARKVHTTHARIVTESVPESAKKKSSGRSFRSVVIQDTPSTLKSKSATSKTKLKGSPSLTLQEQEAADIMQALKESKKRSIRQPGTGAKPGVPDEDKDITEEKVILEWRDEQDSEFFDNDNDDVEKDDKDGDADVEGDDHVSDTQDADDEDVKTESDEDEVYKYKIRVRKDEDVEVKDAEVEEYDKGEEKVTDAAKEEAKKTSEAKDDTKKTELPLSGLSLSVSSGFGDQFFKLSSDSSLVSTVKDFADTDVKTTNLPPIPEIVTETSVSTAAPSPQVTPIISTMQQTPKPIPTPPITTDAPTITTTVPESNALTAVKLSVAKLEKDVYELKTVDHSSEALAVLQSQVPTVVDSYLDTKVKDVFQKELQKHMTYLIHKYSLHHLLDLTKKPTPTAEQESEKSLSDILKIKKEQAGKQKKP
ncbi:putative reverse transcriptase domain-containing protein [Tanacetum coccineum]